MTLCVSWGEFWLTLFEDRNGSFLLSDGGYVSAAAELIVDGV